MLEVYGTGTSKGKIVLLRLPDALIAALLSWKLINSIYAALE